MTLREIRTVIASQRVGAKAPPDEAIESVGLAANGLPPPVPTRNDESLALLRYRFQLQMPPDLHGQT
jgi:hypothetical protein